MSKQPEGREPARSPAEPEPELAPPHWTDQFKKSLPSRESLAAHPWLKPLAHRLLDPSLWHSRHEAIARGAAIGVFWAFAIPVAQFLFAAAHCVWWRGNIPVAAGFTLITNPFTLGFWLWLAYWVGSTLLGASKPAPMAEASGVMAWLATYGGPALLGMAVFAIFGAALAYVFVKLAWHVKDFLKGKLG